MKIVAVIVCDDRLYSNDYKDILNLFPNIRNFTPNNKEELKDKFKEYLFNSNPAFMGIKRELR